MEFYGLCKSNKCRFRTYSDNSGMLVREEKRVQQEWDEASYWKDGDSDVIDLLAKTREELPRISTQHIKGHQDDHEEYDELPRPAQLNVLADELATQALNEAQELSPGQAPRMIPLSNCGAYLIHNERYQTSKEEEVLQYALHEKEMDDYLRVRNEWTQDTVESIDWVAHHRALKRVDWNKKVFILKLSHRWLPTGAKMLTWKKQSHDECKLCKHSETNDHLFQCPQRGIWRADFLDKLRKHLDGFRTAADIRTTILKNVKGWLNGDTIPVEHSVQDGIGWRGFIRGFVSVEFSKLQDQFYRDQHLSAREYSGALWSQRLIEFLWREIHILWKACNKQVHDEAGHKQSARELEEARIKLRAMYARKQELLAADQDLLPGTVAERLALAPSQIIAFVSTTIDTFKFCLQDAQRAVIAGSRDIRVFFPGVNAGNQGRQIREQEAARQASAIASRSRKGKTRPRCAKKTRAKPKRKSSRNSERPQQTAARRKITSWRDYFQNNASTTSSETDPEIPENREPPDPRPEERR